MSVECASARVIVVGNEKKRRIRRKSTVAMNIAIALLKSRQRVATIDLDSGSAASRSTSRTGGPGPSAWAAPWKPPDHFCFGSVAYPPPKTRRPDARPCRILSPSSRTSTTPSSSTRPVATAYLARLAHSLADTLITPLNDSFVDFDVLGTVDPENFGVTGTSRYSEMVEEARRQRQLLHEAATDWIVLRNRLSMLASRNKRLVGEGLHELSQMNNFRAVSTAWQSG